MSYSFTVKAATKVEAAQLLGEELDKVVAGQPVHAADQAQARAAATEFLELLTDDPSQDIYLSVSGSIWQTDAGIQQSSVNVSARLAAKA